MNNKIYVLCEEFEGTDGIRYFTVKDISFDEKLLKDKMRKYIQFDEYGLIAKNGIDEYYNTHFITNYDDGYVEYYIIEKSVICE